MYHVTQLPGGLTVGTAEMPHMTSVSAGVWIGVGSRHEPAPLNGACHFIEHMVFKGTRRRSALEISESVEGAGGYLNAFTSEEMTCYHARAAAGRFGEVLDVLMDMFLNSRFAPPDIDKERDVILEEIDMYLDQPQQLVQELLNATLWPAQPLGRPITGTRQTLRALGRAELRAFMRRHYLSGATVIAAAGNIRHRQVLQAARGYAQHIRPGPRPAAAPANPRQSKPRIRSLIRDTEQTQLALGIRTCSRHDDRRHALRLLNALLGENMSSRLFQVVREEHGLAYSIYSTPSFYLDAGDLVVTAGLDPDHLPRVLGLIQRELRKLRDQPPSAAELHRAREYVLGQTDLSLESTENQMNWLAEQWLGYGKVHSAADFKNRLLQVTPADIQSAARDFFRPDRMNLALVSPRKIPAGLKKVLNF
ncbi:MAG: pitrilysin family protein [Verrucomicrobiota bacterium]